MNRCWIVVAYVLACLICLPAAGTAVLELDASLDDLISPDAKLEKLFERPALTPLEIFECPTWVHNSSPGFLIFCNVPGNVIYRLSPDGKAEVFLDRIYNGKLADANPGAVPNLLMLGANGSTLDRQGRVVYASFSAGQIVRVEKNGKRTILADRFEGNRFNAPNDLVFRSDGSLYFTDSRGSSEKLDSPHCGEYWMLCGPRAKGRIPHLGVYLVHAGKVHLLTNNVPKPNGLTLSPDEKHLYVANTSGTILRFDVREDGTVANENVFVDMTQEMAAYKRMGNPDSIMVGHPDGIRVDTLGNIYCSGPGGVWIISNTGKHLGTILIDQGIASNLTFGDDDAKTLYITSGSFSGSPAVLRIRLKIAGVRP